MKKKFKKFMDRYGNKGLMFLLLYPVILPVLMLKDTSLSIYNIIINLSKYRWKYLSGNDQRNAYNNFFYYIQDYNIQRFGRYGQSNLLAGGSFSLKNWFHATPLSLRMQASFGTTFIMFLAMCVWITLWICLYYENQNLWMLGIVFFSTLFFATFIEIQNYNILGWMLYPLFLTLLVSQNYFILCIVLFFISFLSFTGFFLGAILTFIASIYFHNVFLFISIIPGAIKWLIPVFVSFGKGGLSKMSGILGAHDKVKYSMKKYKKPNIYKVYLLLLQIQFLIISLLINGVNIGVVLLFVTILFFTINELLVRFADQQSFYLLYLSVSLFYILNIDLNTYIVFSYIVSIYPVYGLMINVAPSYGKFISPGIRHPYSVAEEVDGLNTFFSCVPFGSKILAAHKNPNKEYCNIFKNFRTRSELLQYVAIKRGIVIFPDWYMVFENNKQHSDEFFWVDDEKDILDYLESNNIRYVITRLI
ncbi:hypothetical protein [Campylobacter concisus]|uniref:hypothetical protein n=1 Tax=Campylobacter concisus TaxID=199 RepID=UPI000CD7E924|nr:hypothetical protein [Campylobacter concisus]